MRCLAKSLPVYASDTAGVCSALYELGGMCIVHDASGCNSTYSTFDEPRWYDVESMVYISGLTEMDAISGDDAKLVDSIVRAASELHPRFVAICGSPVPMMIGTDYGGIATELEAKLSVPVLPVFTSGINSYLWGASRAFELLVRRFVKPVQGGKRPKSICLLGATPLDIPLNGSMESIRAFAQDAGFDVTASMCMGSTLEDVADAGQSSVSLVLSASGLAAARLLEERFAVPYVVGFPAGAFARPLAEALHRASETGKSLTPCAKNETEPLGKHGAVLGEPVQALSLARALEAETGLAFRTLLPLSEGKELLGPNDLFLDEDEPKTAEAFALASCIVADPMYKIIAPAGTPFHALPHQAFSGRCCTKGAPTVVGESAAKSLGLLLPR